MVVLPAPFGPRNPNTPPSGDLEVETVDGDRPAAPQAPVLLAQPFDLDHAGHAAHHTPAPGPVGA